MFLYRSFIFLYWKTRQVSLGYNKTSLSAACGYKFSYNIDKVITEEKDVVKKFKDHCRDS